MRNFTTMFVVFGCWALLITACSGDDVDDTADVETCDTTPPPDLGDVAFDPNAGEMRFQELCARCHGGNGEGMLAPQLKPWTRDPAVVAKVIDLSMPQDDPSACTGACAEELGSWILGRPTSLQECSPP